MLAAVGLQPAVRNQTRGWLFGNGMRDPCCSGVLLSLIGSTRMTVVIVAHSAMDVANRDLLKTTVAIDVSQGDPSTPLARDDCPFSSQC
jgi:hypothetical protein